MNDDLRYGIAPVDLGVFVGRNRPSDELNETRAYGWRLFSVYLAANAVLCFGWFGWELVK